MDPPSPERLIADRYRLQRVLGRGSMGTVWAAYDEVLLRRVAVKEVLRPLGMPETEADELRERTLREARAIATLSHPNVVTLHDVVRHEGEPYVVMELVPSYSLGELLRAQGPLNTTQAAAVADAVAAALEAAHRARITHRDVKPGNVLVGEDGRIKLTDFGIARNMAEATMTSSGMVLGSPAYIAPEVASGDEVTPAADLWGLGATLFAAVEGHPPYDADGDPVETVSQVIQAPVPRPTRAGELEPVITALMVKDPAERLPLVEVRKQIYSLLPEPGAQVFPPTGEVRGGEGGGRATGTAALPERPRRPRQPSRAKPAIAPDTPLAADPGPLPFGPGAAASSAPPSSPLPEAGSPEAGSPAAAAPLAADPGPLPFPLADTAPTKVRPFVAISTDTSTGTSTGPGTDTSTDTSTGTSTDTSVGTGTGVAPARRRVRDTLVVLVAVVLFVLASVTGFVLARTVSGQAVLPPATSTVSPQPASPMEGLAPTTAQAITAMGEQGGRFSLHVPQGWSQYVEQRAGDSLPPSTVVHFVSPYGEDELTVQRYPRFFPTYQVSEYLAAVSEPWPDGGYVEQVQQVDKTATTGPEPARTLVYRTVERAQRSPASRTTEPEPTQRRTHFLRVLPVGSDLWVVGVSVPSDHEENGQRELFAKIMPTFATTG
ncbi:Serine/threonine protein kinase [Goodfellowiella coeruleoviolacea]|uniref:non-specific serine/threonine protein kinase n=2 Tax=Goodfellowiella coeruleoviolacea TaxID=334858 RepID=A0AAE3GBX5_9PSEU|nr:Serine/threonine protein kinase [Goodfellowiella coeruleoviolacea]